VGYDTFGNSFDGLVGFNEETVDAERMANVGGWGSSGYTFRPHIKRIIARGVYIPFLVFMVSVIYLRVRVTAIPVQ
jgi:hypothetical protein